LRLYENHNKMKLPNGNAAIVDIRKIRDYCLSNDHPRGRHKARVFESALGLAAKDSEELRAALKEAARTGDASAGVADQYGIRYTIDFVMKHRDRTSSVRSCWIILEGRKEPHFVTCFVL